MHSSQRKTLENFREGHEAMREKGTCERRDIEFISILFYHLHHYLTACANKMFENAFR